MTGRIFLLLLLLSACQDRKIPAGILPPAKMQAVFYDYIRADVYINEFMSGDRTLDPQKESVQLQKQLFEKHKISRTQFYESYDYYVDHPELMRDMIDTMVARHRSEDIKTRKNLKLLKEYE